MRSIDATKRFIIVFIILLVTVNQIAVTIYLPSVPHMVTDLHSSYFGVQATIIIYIFGYGFSAFFYGPLSDVHGRKKTLLFGLALFLTGSVIAALCHSIEILLIARLLQGLGNGSGDVVGRAIMCDVYDEKSFVKAASYISMASPFLPMVAPVVGGYLEGFYHWRASFILMVIYSVISFFIVYKFLPETNLAIAFQHRSLKNLFKYMLKSIAVLARSPLFVGFFIPGVVAGLGELTYSLMAPFILQNQLGLTPIQFGWVAILPGVGVFIGAFLSNRLSHKASINNLVLLGLLIAVFASFLMVLLNGSPYYFSALTIVIPMLFYLMSTGIIYPSTNAGALIPFSHIAGAVSAVQSSLQTIFIAMALSLIAHTIAPVQSSLSNILTIISLIGLILFLILAYKRTIKSGKDTEGGDHAKTLGTD